MSDISSAMYRLQYQRQVPLNCLVPRQCHSNASFQGNVTAMPRSKAMSQPNYSPQTVVRSTERHSVQGRDGHSVIQQKKKKSS